MDATRFDRFAVAVGQRTTRRTALGLLAALGLTGLAREHAAAACLDNGVRCGGDRGTCCSGRCVRKSGTDRKFCQAAPDQRRCTTDYNRCDTKPNRNLPNVRVCGSYTGISGTPVNCSCTVTSRGWSYCSGGDVRCRFCASNAECEAAEGPGWVCIRCAGEWGCPGGTACVNPCPPPLAKKGTCQDFTGICDCVTVDGVCDPVVPCSDVACFNGESCTCA